MIWLFERGREDLRVENFFDNVTGEYVLRLRHPDGTCTTERYPNTATLEARLEALESALTSDQWNIFPPACRMKDTWQL